MGYLFDSQNRFKEELARTNNIVITEEKGFLQNKSLS